jgi:integrase
MQKLTAKEVEAISEPGRYAAGDGLYLDVKPNQSKSWLYRYQFQGRRTQLGLGGLSKANTLAVARAKALEMSSLIARGVDPKKHKDEQKLQIANELEAKKKAHGIKKNTFEKVAYDWWESKKSEWTNEKNIAQNINSLKDYVFPVIGAKPISEITVHDVLACLKPIWHDKTETASRVRQRMEKVFAYAKTLGLRSGENPAQLKNNLDSLLPPAARIKRKKALDDPNEGHFASMPYQDVPAFVKELVEQDSLAAKMLLFTIFTAARTGTVLLARWSQIDLEQKVWSIPAKQMKAKVSFKVPLAPECVSLLGSIEKVSDYVFPSPRNTRSPMSNMAMLALLERMKVEEATVHGFRASFRVWAEETTDYGVVAEHALAHQVGSNVERAYQRSDLLEKRRALMRDWAKFLSNT